MANYLSLLINTKMPNSYCCYKKSLTICQNNSYIMRKIMQHEHPISFIGGTNSRAKEDVGSLLRTCRMLLIVLKNSSMSIILRSLMEEPHFNMGAVKFMWPPRLDCAHGQLFPPPPGSSTHSTWSGQFRTQAVHGMVLD